MNVPILASTILAFSAVFVSVPSAFASTEALMQQATLIADVNFANVVATTNDGVLSVSFDLKSSFGSQSSVTYGVVVRGEKSSALLDKKTGGVTNLPEGQIVSKGLLYTLPTYLAEDADVYIASYSSRGVSLALQKVGEVKKGVSKAACLQSKGEVTCTSPVAGTLSVSVQDTTPQGAVVSKSSSSIAANTPNTMSLSTLTSALPARQYFISVSITDSAGAVLASKFTEYVKEGSYVRLLSITPKVSSELGATNLDVTVFALALDLATSTQLTLTAHAGSCGTSSPVAFNDKVKTLSFPTSCSSGEVTVDIMNGTIVVDSLTGIFSSSHALPASPFTAMNILLLGALLALLIVIVAVTIWKMRSKKAVVTTLAVFLAIAGFLSGADKVSAATYVIGGTPQYVPCVNPAAGKWTSGYTTVIAPIKGCEDGGAPVVSYVTSGTVTIPASLSYGQTYTISITHSISAFFRTQCMDVFPTWYTCVSNNVLTRVYHNLPAVADAAQSRYNNLPAGTNGSVRIPSSATWLGEVNYPYTSGIVSATAASSGTTEDVQFLQGASAGFSIECITWKKQCITYEHSYNNVSISLSAPVVPTVDIYFSLIDTVKNYVSEFFTKSRAEIATVK